MSTASDPLDIIAAVRRHGRTRPDAAALSTDSRIVPYGELVALTRDAELLLMNLRPGPIAVVSEKSPRSLALILAGLASRRPVLLPPSGLGPEALEELCTRSAVAAVVGVEQAGYEAAEPAHRPPAADPLMTDACFLLATSGSTGRPKLVPLPVHGVNSFIAWATAHFSLNEESRVLNYAPLHFDLCLLDIWSALASGGRVVLVDPNRSVWPGYLRDLLITTEPTLIQGVPLLYQVLTAAADGATAFPATAHVIVTGDHIPSTVRKRLPALFPRARFHNVYGATETNDSFIYEFAPAPDAEPDVLPIGMPLPGVTAQILAAEPSAEELNTGELLVKTPFQAHGYLGGDPGGTFERRTDGVYFRTGDRVRRDESGLFYLTGRIDFQVKVRGIRVNLEQIEQALAGEQDILEAAAIAVPGEHGTRLHLAVRGVPGSQLTQLTVRERCAARLPPAMIPSSITVTDEALPRTGTGKLARARILRELEGD